MKYFIYMLLVVVPFFGLNVKNVLAQQSSDATFDQYDIAQDDEWDLADFTGYYNEVSAQKCKESASKTEETFSRFDSNGDGFIDSEESPSYIQRYNANPSTVGLVKNGKISKEDFLKCPKFTVQELFDKYDTDKNGIVSRHEWSLRNKAGYGQE